MWPSGELSEGKKWPERDPWFKDNWMTRERECGSCHPFFLLFLFKIEKRTNIKEIIPPLGSFTYSVLPVFSQLWESVEGHPEPIGWCRWSLSWLDRQAVFYSVSFLAHCFLFTRNRVTAVFPCHSHSYFPAHFTLSFRSSQCCQLIHLPFWQNVAWTMCQNCLYLPHPEHNWRRNLKKKTEKQKVFNRLQVKTAAPQENRRVSVWVSRESVDASLSWTLRSWQCCGEEAAGKRLSHKHTLSFSLQCTVFCTRANSKNDCQPSALPMELVHRYAWR